MSIIPDAHELLNVLQTAQAAVQRRIEQVGRNQTLRERPSNAVLNALFSALIPPLNSQRLPRDTDVEARDAIEGFRSGNPTPEQAITMVGMLTDRRHFGISPDLNLNQSGVNEIFASAWNGLAGRTGNHWDHHRQIISYHLNESPTAVPSFLGTLENALPANSPLRNAIHALAGQGRPNFASLETLVEVFTNRAGLNMSTRPNEGQAFNDPTSDSFRQLVHNNPALHGAVLRRLARELERSDGPANRLSELRQMIRQTLRGMNAYIARDRTLEP